MPSPHDSPTQEAAPPQFYPTFHPEFGYLAPKLPFRTKAWLVFKATVFGTIVGAVAVFALVPGRDPPPAVPSAQAMLIAPGDRWHMAPAAVSYVPPTLAMPIASATPQPTGATASLKGANVPQPPVQAVPAAKPKQKKVVRQPKRERDLRPAAPDPRSAYARSVRRFNEPQREWQDRRGFSNW